MAFRFIYGCVMWSGSVYYVWNNHCIFWFLFDRNMGIMILWNEYSRYDYEKDFLRKKQEKGYVRYYAWHPTFVKDKNHKKMLIWLEHYWAYPQYWFAGALEWDKRINPPPSGLKVVPPSAENYGL